ncbi:MAG: hypothetical protein EOP06_16520 [Proteobacteria bacterium]|nr:MAG: hypothetical protein EOP06_16520 [Pseudomonadota bacterium]
MHNRIELEKDRADNMIERSAKSLEISLASRKELLNKQYETLKSKLHFGHAKMKAELVNLRQEAENQKKTIAYYKDRLNFFYARSEVDKQMAYYSAELINKEYPDDSQFFKRLEGNEVMDGLELLGSAKAFQRIQGDPDYFGKLPPVLNKQKMMRYVREYTKELYTLASSNLSAKLDKQPGILKSCLIKFGMLPKPVAEAMELH